MRPLVAIAAVLGAVGAIVGLIVLIRELTEKHSARVIEAAGAGIIIVGVAVLALALDQYAVRRP
jgi:multisubunit Na+/H+ antiporter MnhG subunit